ncbi:MAG: hypothetical protein J6M07_08780 [Ruminococcus sp.]|nr:hypothetical protein [Ruminococcus sp.]
MKAIMNNAMSANICAFDFQQSSYFFQQEDNGSVLLRTNQKSAYSVALTG